MELYNESLHQEFSHHDSNLVNSESKVIMLKKFVKDFKACLKNNFEDEAHMVTFEELKDLFYSFGFLKKLENKSEKEKEKEKTVEPIKVGKTPAKKNVKEKGVDKKQNTNDNKEVHEIKSEEKPDDVKEERRI